MNLRQILIAVGALACILSVRAFAQDSNQWVDIKDPQELRALFSNKTFHVKLAADYSVTYFRADGRGLTIVHDRRFPRTWELKGQQVCISEVTDLNETSCYEVQRNKANPNLIITRDVKTHAMKAFTVEDGVPEF